jgi:amidohydrolase
MHTIYSKVIPEMVTQLSEFRLIRRDIHAHPELSYDEHRTSQKVADLLTSWGIEVHRYIGKTGVVGVIKTGSSSRSIGLRADMDALPLQELNTFSHASRYDGKMHACGHDGHTTMLLMAAKYLSKNINFDGTVYLIFQPAEEGGAGAKAMIDDGLFEKFPMQAVFGLHNWPGKIAGQLAASAGPVMASCSPFKIILTGCGGHAAMPNLTRDTVPAACQLVLAFQTIISRNMRPTDAGVVSVTMIHVGAATNIIADRCEIQGTVRAFTEESLDLIESRMRELAMGTCSAYGVEVDFKFDRDYPSVINSVPESKLAYEVMARLVGSEHALEQDPTMGAEDFAFMLKEKPGCYAFIHNGLGDHRSVGHGGGPCTLHNTSYDFNDEIIPVGATYWVRLAEAWFLQ